MAEDSESCFQFLLGGLDRVIEALKQEDYAAVESGMQHLVVTFTGFTKDYRFPHLLGDRDMCLYGRISDALAEYLCLADRLFGQSPYVTARENLEQLLKNARSMLELPSPEAAHQARVIIDDALSLYEQEVKQIERGGHFDLIAVTVFWKLWPVMDMFIRHLPPDDYSSMALRLYGIVSEGLRSAGAVRLLKKSFDEVFPFKGTLSQVEEVTDPKMI